MLNAISRSRGALRGVAVAGPDADIETLDAWRQAGVVGLRFTEARGPDGARRPGSIGFEALQALSPKMRDLGLHAQLWAQAADFAKWLPRLLTLDVPLVLDHMGSPDPARGLDDPSFRVVLSSLDTGRLWVKLVIGRVSQQPPRYGDAKPFHDALVAAAPERMVWGSDWPYVRMAPAPDAGHMIDVFHDWTPADAARRRILVDNPAALYGFTGVLP
jgi:predicted TIM-barrel fold metal-dependent hydrolase